MENTAYESLPHPHSRTKIEVGVSNDGLDEYGRWGGARARTRYFVAIADICSKQGVQEAFNRSPKKREEVLNFLKDLFIII
jgi:hypothetical protein